MLNSPTAADFGPPVMPGAQLNQGFMDGRPGSPGLEAQSARWNAMAQAAAVQPHSVLNQLAPSPVAANLSAPSQRDRLLPNGFVLGNTRNGAAEPTAQTENYLNMGVAE
jgi:hypothetical protein